MSIFSVNAAEMVEAFFDFFILRNASNSSSDWTARDLAGRNATWRSDAPSEQ
jgi:hypothetical protein